MEMAQKMLRDLRLQTRSSASETEVIGSDVVFHFPLGRETCVSEWGADEAELELEACTSLPFAEYVVTKRISESTGMSCCEASGIVIADLLRQADKSRFEQHVCPTGCDSTVAAVATHLPAAKATVHSLPNCVTTAFDVFELVDDSGELKRHHFERYIQGDSICWLQWLLPWGPMDNVTAACSAADIVLAQHVWLYAPAIAPDVYDPGFYHALADPALDDDVVGRALSAVCDNTWAGQLDALLEKSKMVEPLRGFSFQDLCEDPCRCKTGLRLSDEVAEFGCGLHLSASEKEPAGLRPHCHVVDPSRCEKSVPSSIPELQGEAWVFCSVGYDTCQEYSGVGPCASFVPEGANVFIPKGTTQESLQFIDDAVQENAAANEFLGLVGDGNWLDVWLLEAGLVSPACYAAHGRRVCDARLHRCTAGQSPQSLPVCHADCGTVATQNAGVDCGKIISDPLRCIDDEIICDWRLLPQGFREKVSDVDRMDADRLQVVLGIDLLLKTEQEVGDTSQFGQLVYPNEADSECFNSQVESAVDFATALVAMSCPEHFVLNEHGTVGGSAETDAFCIGTCPSNAYTSTQYWVMWAFFVVPGMIAFLVNISALVSVAMGQSATNSSDAATLLLIRLSALAGLLGVVPVLAHEDLLCTCDTELCFRNDLLCKLNQTSIYVVMATSFCLLYKFAWLLTKLRNPSVVNFPLYNWKTLLLVWVVPLALAAISFGVEQHGNESFHLAKAGVRCQFRYRSIRDESLLLHVPMALCVIVLGHFIVGNVKICLEAVLLQHEQRNFRNVWNILKARPQLRKMMSISCGTSALIVVWLSQAIANWWVSENYLQAMEEWLQCIRFDFARHTAYGVVWTETVDSFKDGELCPAFPEGLALYELQLLKGIFEVLLPGMVSATFSWRLIKDALQARRAASVKRGNRTATSIAPLNFDSRAYDRNSECCSGDGKGEKSDPQWEISILNTEKSAKSPGAVGSSAVAPSSAVGSETNASVAGVEAPSEAGILVDPITEPGPAKVKTAAQLCGVCHAEVPPGSRFLHCTTCPEFASCVQCHEAGVIRHNRLHKLCWGVVESDGLSAADRPTTASVAVSVPLVFPCAGCATLLGVGDLVQHCHTCAVDFDFCLVCYSRYAKTGQPDHDKDHHFIIYKLQDHQTTPDDSKPCAGRGGEMPRLVKMATFDRSMSSLNPAAIQKAKDSFSSPDLFPIKATETQPATTVPTAQGSQGGTNDTAAASTHMEYGLAGPPRKRRQTVILPSLQHQSKDGSSTAEKPEAHISSQVKAQETPSSPSTQVPI
jgi:hypothetical protein